MFNFLKKKEETVAGAVAVVEPEVAKLSDIDKKRRKNKNTDINTIAELYVETVTEPGLSPEELDAQITKNLNAIVFLTEEMDETNFANENKAYRDAIDKLTKRTAHMQVELLQKKFAGQYTKIDLSFLSMKKANKDETRTHTFSSDKGCVKDFIPYVPAFSVHKLRKDSEGFEFGQCVIELEISGTVNDEKALSQICLRGLPLSILRKMGNAFTQEVMEEDQLRDYSNSPQWSINTPRSNRSWFSQNVVLSQGFHGMMPSETKKRVTEAYDKFTEIMGGRCEIFLIKECESWKSEVVTKDPLVVGMIGDQAYLIDHFDCTDLEAYVNSEFTS